MPGLEKHLRAVEKKQALLVYPLENRKVPPSLWGELHPRTEMRWEWDDDGDAKVSDLWRKREELSRSGKVVYSKWYRGRATFFSRECFVDLLVASEATLRESQLTGEAGNIYDVLCESSPLSTKDIKRATELVGKSFETLYAKSMKKLFESGLIVGWGEVDDGAFPSLATGATKLMFEDLWSEAGERAHETEAARERLRRRWSAEFDAFFTKILAKRERP